MEKTNVIRLLDANKIQYEAFEYGDETDACKVAKLINANEDVVFNPYAREVPFFYK